MDQQLGWVVFAILIVGLWIVTKIIRYQQRKSYLVKKYGDEAGLKILARKVWQGMTQEQLTESWGKPVDVDHMVLKTKTKETWKYNQTGKNRFKDRIYLEDGSVVGWKD
jgi:hypothetical protein